MAQQHNTKSMALGKDEVMFLINLISNHKVLTTKATNASNNRIKDDAWKANNLYRLEWENLKKAARKRNAAIRQNNLKTGGGKTYIPPDEPLDQVASMLGATCSGFTVEFGGDREIGSIEPNITEALVEVEPLPEIEVNSVLMLDGDDAVECEGGNEHFTRKTKI